jgi:hypothetical protein
MTPTPQILKYNLVVVEVDAKAEATDGSAGDLPHARITRHNNALEVV